MMELKIGNVLTLIWSFGGEYPNNEVVFIHNKQVCCKNLDDYDILTLYDYRINDDGVPILAVSHTEDKGSKFKIQ